MEQFLSLKLLGRSFQSQLLPSCLPTFSKHDTLWFRPVISSRFLENVKILPMFTHGMLSIARHRSIGLVPSCGSNTTSWRLTGFQPPKFPAYKATITLWISQSTYLISHIYEWRRLTPHSWSSDVRPLVLTFHSHPSFYSPILLKIWLKAVCATLIAGWNLAVMRDFQPLHIYIYTGLQHLLPVNPGHIDV